MSRVAEEFPSPPCPHPSVPGTLLPLRVTLEVFPPWGKSATPGASVPLDDSNPPPTPWQSPPGFSVNLEALGPPLLSPTPEDFTAGFSCQPATSSLYLFVPHAPPPAPAASKSVLVASRVSPPPAVAPPGPSYATLLYDASAIAIRIILTSPAPLVVSAS